MATGPIYRGARYSPARRRAGDGALVVGESEDKVKEAGGDSLEEEVVKRKAVKKKSRGRRSRYVGRKADIKYINLTVK